MLRAVAGYPPRADLAAGGDELPQQTGVLVVHPGHLLLTEKADLLLRLADRWFGHRGAPSQSRPQAGVVGRAPPAGGGVGYCVGFLAVFECRLERRLVGEAVVAA